MSVGEEPKGADQPIIAQLFLTLGVWLLSDSLSLKEAWVAVRTHD